jgi:hypothetical protein
MVAHLWANQSQETARSHNGNFWFEGPTLYSYSTPIANLVRDHEGHLVALVTCEAYSMTTSSKHMPTIGRATDYGRTVPEFRVPSIGAWGGRSHSGYAVDHAANMAHFTTCYAKEKARLMRCRDLPHGRVTHWLERIDTEARHYATLFGLIPLAFEVNRDGALILDAHRKRNTPEAIAKRERERAKREERNAAKRAREEAERFERETKQREAWLAGEGHYWHGRTPEGGAYIRARGDMLETSQGARVPLPEAIAAFRFVKLCKERGTGWQRNGHTLRVGQFQLDRVYPNGDFRAGCHLIQWTECERLALALGVFDEAASDAALVDTQHAA